MAVKKRGKSFILLKGIIMQLKRDVRDIKACQNALEKNYQFTNHRITENDVDVRNVKLPNNYA